MKEDLLIKHFLSEATAAESAAIEIWLKESESNRLHYEQLVSVWEYAGRLKGKSPLAADEAWSRFLAKKAESGPQNQRMAVRSLRINLWLRVAAVLFLLAGASWTAWRLTVNRSPELILVQAGAAVKHVSLPDGSTVQLNAGSAIRYPEQFDENRQVSLTGEAYFDVQHGLGTFSVTSGKTKVTVLGTAFNVKRTRSKVEVIVARGLVRVSRGKAAVKLSRQQRVTVDDFGQALKAELNHDVMYRFYAGRTIVADNTPMEELVSALNKAFKADIRIISPATKKIPITVTFKDEDLEGALRVLKLTEPTLSIQRRGSSIYLR
ncbi:FecR family protein [Pedobacter yulinensis]|nr:FecR domain-containing protein [Pedobacter yulinensis]